MRRKDNLALQVFIMFTLILIVVAVIVTIFYAVTRKRVDDCKVINKESVALSDGHEYRVYTENCGTMSVKDSVFLLRFNSADIYGRVQPGATYNFETQGFRLPVASMFPNIVSAVEVR